MDYLYQEDREDRAPGTDNACGYENRPKFKAPTFSELPLDWLSPIYAFDVRPPSEQVFHTEGSEEAPEGFKE
jgi:hypothetical protein